MKVFLPAFLALAALAPCSAGFAQQAPPAKLTTAQTKQIAKAQTVMNGFMAAARKGDTKKAKTFCADTREMNFEGLLDAENAARLKAWANTFPQKRVPKRQFPHLRGTQKNRHYVWLQSRQAKRRHVV